MVCYFKKLELKKDTKYLNSIMPIHKAQTAVRAQALSPRRESQRCMKTAILSNAKLLFHYECKLLLAVIRWMLTHILQFAKDLFSSWSQLKRKPVMK